jgi:hypothetical protein
MAIVPPGDPFEARLPNEYGLTPVGLGRNDEARRQCQRGLELSRSRNLREMFVPYANNLGNL